MAKILCIEDSSEFFMYLTSVLSEHHLSQASSLQEGFRYLQTGRESFDLILLDLSLPDGSGMKALPNFRVELGSKNIPIIILSSDNETLSKVTAFAIGADDYVSKPPEPNELRARIDARLRSARVVHQSKNQIVCGDLVIDSERMSVELRTANTGVKVLELTPSEFKILRLVASRPGQVYTRDQVIDNVWGIGKYVSPRTVDAHVSHLRKKISESRVVVSTVLSVGYKASIRDTP